jgi:hypothetical protein
MTDDVAAVDFSSLSELFDQFGNLDIDPEALSAAALIVPLDSAVDLHALADIDAAHFDLPATLSLPDADALDSFLLGDHDGADAVHVLVLPNPFHADDSGEAAAADVAGELPAPS